MVVVGVILASTIIVEHAWNLHILFVILLACHPEEMLGPNRLNINAIVFKGYSQLTTVFILNWQNKRGGNSIVCLAANGIFDA